MKTTILNIFIKAFSIFFGLIMVLTFLWLRFIRERLPKDLPFILNILGFIILLYICFIYSYIIFSLIIQRKANPFITALIKKLYKPLEDFDHFFKDLPIINHYYKSFIIKLAYKLHNSIIETYKYFYIFAIIPRIILILTLCIDTYYYHKLFFIYKVLFLYIFLILNRYIIYSLKYAKEHFIIQLQPYISSIVTDYVLEVAREIEGDDDQDGDQPTMCIPLKRFILLQTESIVNNDYKYNYRIFTKNKYDDEFRIKHKIPVTMSDKDFIMTYYKQISSEIKIKIENITQISLLIEHYDLANNYYEKGKRIKILIYTNYLLCWLYILIISLNSLIINPILIIDILKSFQEHLEPFSGISLF